MTIDDVSYFVKLCDTCDMCSKHEKLQHKRFLMRAFNVNFKNNSLSMTT